jgi:hypothetical protein
MTDRNREKEPNIPTDTDELPPDSTERKRATGGKAHDRGTEPNPPRTTTGGNFTAPKFGSAGSGGLELEPGLDVD